MVFRNCYKQRLRGNCLQTVWQDVENSQGNSIKNKGKNIWLFEANEGVFAGLELDNGSDKYNILEQKNIVLTKYAYYKHIGPYNSLKKVGTNRRNELKSSGFEIELPYIGIYGH